MTQQFLNDFDILAVGFEERRKRVAKRMPRKLLRDPQLLSDRLDVISHHGTQPYRLLSAFRSGPFGISSRSQTPLAGIQSCSRIGHTAPEIADYRDQFQRLKDARARLAKFRPNPEAQAKAKAVREKEAAGEALPAQLNRTWAEFLKLILATKRKGHVVEGTAEERSYLQTAERCHMLFAKHGHLANMAVVDRQFIGGTSRAGGWFGSMKGAGYFEQRLNGNAASLDAALDHIPRGGAVSKCSFDDFAANYRWERSGVGTASRLLAMKRPDLFLCVDAKNRAGIA